MALAFIFDGVGAGEWLVLLAVLLVVSGPEKLPGTARAIARGWTRLRRAGDKFLRELMEGDDPSAPLPGEAFRMEGDEGKAVPVEEADVR